MTNTSTQQRVWFITGCSSGFGHAIAEVAIESGDIVVATARDVKTLSDLHATLTLPLDVTKPEMIKESIDLVYQRFGRIDILVNNAGYGNVGTIEEVSLDEIRRIFEVNFFGPITLTKTVLSHMRSQHSGTIVQMSSCVSFAVRPTLGYYCATKAALEVISEALAAEAAQLGIRVLIVEPGSFNTQWGSNATLTEEISDYAHLQKIRNQFATLKDTPQPGDPKKAAHTILSILDSPTVPLHLPLGKDAFAFMHSAIESKMHELEDLQLLDTQNTDFD